MNLTWRPSASASCLQAVAAIAAGRTLVDARLAAALGPPAGSLVAELAAAGIDRQAFFDQAAPLAAAWENNRELASRALSKVLGHADQERLAGRLAGWLSQLELAYARAVPEVVAELDLRGRPLREQWEARGPGLLAAIGRLTEPGLLAEAAEIVLLYPALGGNAEVYLASNQVAIEAVLANPFGELPEVVRLGWLLSTLNLDLPKYSETIPRSRLTSLAKWSLLPAALAAAAEVELSPAGRQPLSAAVAAWRLAEMGGEARVESLERWWATYQDRRPSWAAALAALDQMLGSSADANLREKRLP